MPQKLCSRMHCFQCMLHTLHGTQNFNMACTCLPPSSSPLTFPRAFPASSRRSRLVSTKLQVALLAFQASLAGKPHRLVSQLSTCSFTCRCNSSAVRVLAAVGEWVLKTLGCSLL